MSVPERPRPANRYSCAASVRSAGLAGTLTTHAPDCLLIKTLPFGAGGVGWLVGSSEMPLVGAEQRSRECT